MLNIAAELEAQHAPALHQLVSFLSDQDRTSLMGISELASQGGEKTFVKEKKVESNGTA